LLVAVCLLAIAMPGLAAADVPLVPPLQPDAPASLPLLDIERPLFLSAPWDTNVLADSLNTSPPPDGALFVAREVGPDSSIVVLTYNYLSGSWYCRISRSTNSGKTYTPQTVGSGYWVDPVLHGNGRDTLYHGSVNSFV